MQMLKGSMTTFDQQVEQARHQGGRRRPKCKRSSILVQYSRRDCVHTGEGWSGSRDSLCPGACER